MAKKTSFIIVFVLIMFSVCVYSISGGAKYYSPVVTGQYNDYIVDNDLIFSTQIGSDTTVFSECGFAGSSDNDFRYMNVDDNNNIYLTDDDYINIFDENCGLLTSYAINGTLQSQPYVYDFEDDGFSNIIYISEVDTVQQVNEFEFSDVYNIIFNYRQNLLLDNTNYHCMGLYCDINSWSCATLCSNAWYVIEVPDLSFSSVSAGTNMCSYSEYDEGSDYMPNPCSTDGNNFYDRMFPSVYGMDIDIDGKTEACAIYASNDGANPREISFTSVNLVDKSVYDIDKISYLSNSGGNSEIYGSGGIMQVAQYSSFYPTASTGEIFLAYSDFISKKVVAKVLNSVGTTVKTVANFVATKPTKQMSNFAVSDIDGDLKNDFCIAFNETELDGKTHLYCYSGANINLAITNCTLDDWIGNNPISLSMVRFGQPSSPYIQNIVTTFGVYDLYKNDGGSCINVKESGWTGLDSFSSGALVPVDVSGDDKPDFIYYGADGAKLFKSESVQEPTYNYYPKCAGEHVFFCDNFNYEYPLYYNNWNIFVEHEQNYSATPIDNQLLFGNSHTHAIVDLPSTYVTYNLSQYETVIKSKNYPVVTAKFSINGTYTNKTAELAFILYDNKNRASVAIAFYNHSIWAWNSSILTYDYDVPVGGEIYGEWRQGMWQYIGDYMTVSGNDTLNVRIQKYVGLDTSTEYSIENDGATLPYIPNVMFSSYDVFINGEEFLRNFPFADNRSALTDTLYIEKPFRFPVFGNLFGIDDLYLFRGTSQTVNNEEDFFGQYYTPPEDINVTTGETNKQTNAIKDMLVPFAESSHLGYSTLWVLIMFSVGIFILVILLVKGAGGAVALSVVCGAELLLTILGVMLDFIGVAIIILFTLFAILVISGVVAKKMLVTG